MSLHLCARLCFVMGLAVMLGALSFISRPAEAAPKGGNIHGTLADRTGAILYSASRR